MPFRGARFDLFAHCPPWRNLSDLVDRIRPVAVLVAVLKAGSGGPIVSSWESPNASPLVFTWQGQSGHDRHNTDPQALRLSEWAPEMAAQVRQAVSERAV